MARGVRQQTCTRLVHGVLLCALAALFAVGVKVAAYHPSPQARTFSSLRAHESDLTTLQAAVPVLQLSTSGGALPPLLAACTVCIALLVIPSLTRSVPLPADGSSAALGRWRVRSAAVRPPPAII